MNPLNQTEEKREAVPNGVSRVGIAVLGVLLQVLWIVWAALKLTRYYAWVQLAISVLAFLLALRIYQQRHQTFVDHRHSDLSHLWRLPVSFVRAQRGGQHHARAVHPHRYGAAAPLCHAAGPRRHAPGPGPAKSDPLPADPGTLSRLPQHRCDLLR